jgi:hypothetical protein
MPELSLAFLTLYAELQQQLETVTERPGSVFEQTIKNTVYLKAQIETAGRRTSIHLGRADDPDVRARADAIAAEMQRAKGRRQIVRTLRNAGFGQPSPAIADICEALAGAGLFGRGAILIGTGAYQCFPALVGRTLPGAAMMTQDADIATATLALAAERDPTGDVEPGLDSPEPLDRSLLDILKQADPTFEGVPSLGRRALPSRFKAHSGFLFELLSPRRRRDDPDPIPVPGLQAAAAPIQQLEYLLVDAVPAVLLQGAGTLIRVPAPARYAVHKLIVARKRQVSSAAKRLKDLEQARSLIEALRERDRWSLADAFEDARGRGEKGWGEPIARSLAELQIDLP